MAKIKCVEERALFAKNKVRFARAEAEQHDLKPGFHYPSWPVNSATRLVETRARQHGPCWRVMETGHRSTRAVNSGRQLG